MTSKTWIKIGLVTIIAGVAAGCHTLQKQRTHRANSLFKYLYSEDSRHIDTPGIPVLSLPLRVAVAFVPTDGATERGEHPDDLVFSEIQKMGLMKEVSQQF